MNVKETVSYIRDLKNIGVKEEEAEKLVEIISECVENTIKKQDLVTRSDLKVALLEFELRINEKFDGINQKFESIGKAINKSQWHMIISLGSIMAIIEFFNKFFHI